MTANTTPYAPQFAARQTTYNGVQMRSRLEARYAQWLDEIGAQWQYEPQCFASERGQYLPDFQIDNVHVFGSPRTLFVDVKPRREDVTSSLGKKMSIIWATCPDAFLGVEVPSLSIVVIVFPHNMLAKPAGMIWHRDTDANLGLTFPVRRSTFSTSA